MVSRVLMKNVKREFEKKRKIPISKMGQKSFDNFSVVLSTGIAIRRIPNTLPMLLQGRSKSSGKDIEILYPDTLVGTDSIQP